ncbi:FecR family protein [Cellulophaga sp. Z1A5H]|uniref:FecR family protein n=1 Tax=Cellulophaga sp. Z1A5H TaxID=2687291 RepID=UPI0013FD3A79|nr:FecR family protein [Cellulophaga sp. Z1A5H]
MLSESKSILKKLLAKSIRNKTSASEDKLLQNLLKKVYHKTSWDEKTMGDKHKIKNEIRSKIDLKPVKVLNLSVIKYAAAIISIVTLAFLFHHRNSTPKMLVTTTERVLDSVLLQDGSLVYLAPNSSLEYPETFKGKERNVKLLKGNAFFEVTKDPKHPFIIHSGQVKTKVLGTSFHIRLAEKSCRVSVVTGKVEVNYKNSTENLIPGEEAHTNGKLLKKETTPAIMAYNWYTQDVSLKEVKLREVLHLMHLKYGVTNTINSSKINDLKLTLFIGKKAAVEEILKQINYITNLNLSYENEIITQDSK